MRHMHTHKHRLAGGLYSEAVRLHANLPRKERAPVTAAMHFGARRLKASRTTGLALAVDAETP